MQPPQAAPSPSGAPSQPPKARGPRVGILLGAVVVLVLIVGGGYFALRGTSSPIAAEIAKATGDSAALKSMAASDIAVLSGTLQSFRIDADRYPTAEEGLEALRTRPEQVKEWRGPYTTKEIPNDPWGNPYVYQWPGPLGDDSFSLLSYGSDNAPGGTGDAEDIAEGDQ